MIEVSNLSIYYDNMVIINNLSFKIKRGEFVSFIGSNGSGKTTLLKALAGINKKYQGQIMYNGKASKEYSKKEFASLVSLFTPIRNSIPDFTVEEFVSFGRAPYKKWNELNRLYNDERQLIKTALIKTSAIELTNRKLTSLSSGEFQKVRLALILAQDSEVIILDEPITHLDLKSQEDFLNILSDLNKTMGKTIIGVFHEINLAVKYSDRIIAMKQGNILFEGQSHELVNEKLIASIFNIKSDILVDNLTGKKYILP